MDAHDVESIREATDEVAARLGRLDILANCIGMNREQKMAEELSQGQNFMIPDTVSVTDSSDQQVFNHNIFFKKMKAVGGDSGSQKPSDDTGITGTHGFGKDSIDVPSNILEATSKDVSLNGSIHLKREDLSLMSEPTMIGLLEN